MGVFHGSAGGGEVAEVNQVLHRRRKRFDAQAHSLSKGGELTTFGVASFFRKEKKNDFNNILTSR